MTGLAKGTRLETLPATRGGRVAAVAAMWIAAASVTGYLHGVELLIARTLGGFAWFSREFVWMAPIAYAIVMAPAAILLFAVSATVRDKWALWMTAAVFTTISVFGLLLPFTQVSRLSSLILSLGVGVGVARAVNARPALWLRRARIAAVASVIATLIIAPAQRGWRVMRETRVLAALPPAPANATNVLVIILDTVRAASMGLYSTADSTTPRLNAWARSSTVFDWAFSPSSWTLPSHGSMFTGAWAGELSGDWEAPLDAARPTLAERFRDRGYLTAAFVANMHYTAWDSGLDRGFARYEDYLVNAQQLMWSSSYSQTEMYHALRRSRDPRVWFAAFRNPNLWIDPKHRFSLKRGEAVTDAFLDWHESTNGRPFFTFLNYFDAHQPYYAPPEFQRFPGTRGRGRYAAAIAYLDVELDRLLNVLQQRGALDNTLVVITSDHGELFEFKGLSGHAHNVYLNTIRVPLLVRLPGRVPEGLRVAQPVTLRDLAATILDLTAMPVDQPLVGGTSLRAAWAGPVATSPVMAEVRRAPNIASQLPTAHSSLQTLVDPRWQLIRHEANDSLELYDYREDLALDLARVDSVADVRASLRQQLLDLLRTRR